MAAARIFSSRGRVVGPERPWLLSGLFAAAIVLACAVERGAGDGLVLLFGVPALLFGALIGRWWAVGVPVLLTTSVIAVGVECSTSEQPQALLLAGAVAGVAIRRLRDRLADA